MQFDVERSEQYQILEDRDFMILIPSVTYDENIQALRVILPKQITQLCQNDHPHITLSYREGIEPHQSNDMLASALSQHTEEIFPTPIELSTKGVFIAFEE
jgi:2'-5' RNA ligase